MVVATRLLVAATALALLGRLGAYSTAQEAASPPAPIYISEPGGSNAGATGGTTNANIVDPFAEHLQSLDPTMASHAPPEPDTRPNSRQATRPLSYAPSAIRDTGPSGSGWNPDSRPPLELQVLGSSGQPHNAASELTPLQSPAMGGVVHPAPFVENWNPDPKLELEGEVEEPWETSLALTPRMVGFQLHRDGSSWLVGSGDDFGMFSLESVGEFQIFGSENLYSGHAIHFVGGPVQTDMPPRMFELYWGYRDVGEINERWGYDFAISPGIHTDFEGHAHQGWRVRGLGVAKFHVSPIADIVFGVAYLDRENLKLLPVAGLVFQWDESTRFELVFPEPRISKQYYVEGYLNTIYVRGELGGGSWAIERDSLANDIATYQDLRALVGFEREMDEGRTNFFEFGYVFDRELEYRSGIGDMKFRDTVLVRAGVRY